MPKHPEHRYQHVHRAEFDKRIKRIAPWFCAVVLWSSLIFYLLIVDLAVIPQSHRPDPIFSHNVSTPSDGQRTDATPLNATVGVSVDTSPGQESSSSNASNAPQTTLNTSVEAQSAKFLDTFVGVPGGRVNRLNVAFGLLIISISGYISVRFSHVLGGLPAMVISFIAGSLVGTKIFFWLSDPSMRYLLVATRVFESAILVIIGARLKRFHTDYLHLLGSMFAVNASLAFSLTMMAHEPQLIAATTVLLPLWIILLAIPVMPIIMRSLTPRDALFRKMELWLVALAPFCVAVLLNWWFHIAWLGDIDIPKVSYKNTLVIYLLGLVFGSLLLLLKYISYLRTSKFSWPLALLILTAIAHLALLKSVATTYLFPTGPAASLA